MLPAPRSVPKIPPKRLCSCSVSSQTDLNESPNLLTPEIRVLSGRLATRFKIHTMLSIALLIHASLSHLIPQGLLFHPSSLLFQFVIIFCFIRTDWIFLWHSCSMFIKRLLLSMLLEKF